jgi:hypothetical protein
LSGEAGLQQKQEELEAAIEENEREPPELLLRSLPIPGTETITYHPITSYTSASPLQPTGTGVIRISVNFLSFSHTLCAGTLRLASSIFTEACSTSLLSNHLLCEKSQI